MKHRHDSVKHELACLRSFRFQELSRHERIDAGSALEAGAARNIDESGSVRVRSLAVALRDVVRDGGAGFIQVLGGTWLRSLAEAIVQQLANPSLELDAQAVYVQLLMVEYGVIVHSSTSNPLFGRRQTRLRKIDGSRPESP